MFKEYCIPHTDRYENYWSCLKPAFPIRPLTVQKIFILNNLTFKKTLYYSEYYVYKFYRKYFLHQIVGSKEQDTAGGRTSLV